MVKVIYNFVLSRELNSDEGLYIYSLDRQEHRKYRNVGRAPLRYVRRRLCAVVVQLEGSSRSLLLLLLLPLPYIQPSPRSRFQGSDDRFDGLV